MKDVFISYSRKDMRIAEEICDALDKADISYFIDRQDIGIGHPFAEIARAIKECTLFLYLGSKNAYVSIYAPKEINYAIRHKEKNSILPYLIDDTPMPDELDLLLCDYNWRNKREHPIVPTLINDLLDLLGRKGKENSLYSISLVSAGAAKLQVVKEVIELLGLGLKEAKDFVDDAPCELPGVFSPNDASHIKSRLEGIGAIVDFHPVTNNLTIGNGRYYIELLSAFSSNLRLRDAISKITPFTNIEASEYLANTPCILPFLSNNTIASALIKEAERTGTKIRLIPYGQNNSSVEFKLLTAGQSKLQVVKYVKENLKMGLKEAKDLVDSAPSVIASTDNFQDSLWFVKGLRDCGAIVSVILK